MEEQEGAQGCLERVPGWTLDYFGEHFGAVRSGKAARKEGRKRGEAMATREKREAIKGEAERKDKESTQVSKPTSTSKQAVIRV